MKAVWLDVDPGHDDAIALVLAGYHPLLDLLGVSTVAGNQTVDKVTSNCLSILEAAGLDRVGRTSRLTARIASSYGCLAESVEVFKGQAKPLLRPSAILCPEIHGESGLGLRNASLPAANRAASPGKAVIMMHARICAHYSTRSAKVYLVCTGALTNAALLIMLFPEIADMLEQIVIMGGCMGIGNTHPVAEFNFQTDPEAAKAVFDSGVPIVLVPLEVTHSALATEAVIQQICPLDKPFGRLVRDILLYFADTYRDVFKFSDPPLHDPCAVAFVADPAIFTVQAMWVDIETASPLSAGQSVCDVWRQSGKSPNALVAKALAVPAFWSMVEHAVASASRASALDWS